MVKFKGEPKHFLQIHKYLAPGGPPATLQAPGGSVPKRVQRPLTWSLP